MDTVVDPLEVARYVCSIVADVERQGIRVEAKTDFGELQRFCEKIEGKAPLSEPFSPAFFDIMPAQGLWLGGTDETGAAVHVQAMRLDDLSGTDLASHWQQQLKRIHCAGREGALDGTACPAARWITGRVVYHGEIWVAAQFRRQGLGGTLSRLALALALQKWDPAYIYAFVSDALVRRGSHSRMGYLHSEPDATGWHRPPSNINADDWLVWMGHEDLQRLVRQRVQ